LGAGSTEQDTHKPILVSLEQYQDSTRTDNKESFSLLKPVVLATGLLKAEFNADHCSGFITGYIHSFSNKKPQQPKHRGQEHCVGLVPLFVTIISSVFQFFLSQ
jgi:hypothetical protein